MTELSIIVLSYNTSGATLHCLQSLVKQYQTELKNGAFEVILVDNNSSDDSVKKLKEFVKDKSNINFIQNSKNLGFGGGNNKGVSESRGKFVLFLNSDTVVMDKGLLKMIEFLKTHPKIGILGGKLSGTNGKVQRSAGTFYSIPSLFLTLFGGGRLGLLKESPNSIKKVDWVMGALCMVRREVFEKAGGYDEKIFMYVEDMELCYRVKQLGFDTFFYPDIEVRHTEMGSSNRTFAITSIYKGILYYFKKHKSASEYQLAKLLLTIKAKLAIGIGTITGNSYLSQTYKKAVQF